MGRILWFVCISNLYCDGKSSMMQSNVSTLYFVYVFIYLFNICLFDWFYSISKTGFRIFSNTFRSIFSPIDNVFCSRCWLAKHFKTLSNKLMLIGQKFSKLKTRWIRNSFCHFIGKTLKRFEKRFRIEKHVYSETVLLFYAQQNWFWRTPYKPHGFQDKHVTKMEWLPSDIVHQLLVSGYTAGLKGRVFTLASSC